MLTEMLKQLIKKSGGDPAGATSKAQLLDKLCDCMAGSSPKKLSDLENDLFYKKRTPLVTLTKDDFTIDENGAALYTMDRSSLGAYTGFGFDLHEVMSWEEDGETVTEEYSSTEQDEADIQVNNIGDIRTYWYDAAYMEIVDGGTYDYMNDSYTDDNVIQIFLNERSNLVSLELVLYLLDEKKIPIEYCDTSEIEAEIVNLISEVEG